MQVNRIVNIQMLIGRKMEASRRARGRPKHIDDDKVLDAVLGVFWEKGSAGSSLSDLADAAGVSRPKLYDALADKSSMYLVVLDRVISDTKAAIDFALPAKRPLRDELSAFFDMSIDHYLSGARSRGCLVMCTAPAEALETPAVRAALARIIAVLDGAFQVRFQIAQDRGEMGSALSAAMLARQATAMVQSLALRARSGADKNEMRAMARAAAALLSGDTR
jgi:TetR/AcrR family transcriptional regulator, copper-responsive repressor